MKLASRLLGLSAVLLLLGVTGQVAPPPDQPRHGLLGHYYTSTNYHHSATVDEFWIPVPIGAPAATRVDPQIAFGKGRGFEWEEGGHNRQSVWWTPQKANGVIWNGYIRLPKAGTYYFSTVSNGPSAVYLNQARVWLNGRQAGNTVPGEVFSYVDPGSSSGFNPEQKIYLVPVRVEKEQVLPIEVRYLRHTHRGGPRGIDLYWVTPDSLADADGKPIAQIIPAEALYVDPPGPVRQATTSGIHCTISSDFLYFPAAYGDNYVTLTIRLADEKGRPVSGHRVHVSGLVSYGRSDEIIQPEKPTDEHGITTARVRAGAGHKVRHDSRFYATDLTDFVSVEQVCHVKFIMSSPAFLPLTYAPYYDDKAFLVEPMPLRIGAPAKITIPLENRDRRPAELTVTFLTQGHNIGGTDWGEVGKVDNVRLEPGETREVSVSWSPKVEAYVCIKVEVFGRYLSDGTGQQAIMRRSAFAPDAVVRPVLAQNPAPGSEAASTAVFESIQRNLGSPLPLETVSSAPPEQDSGDPDGDGDVPARDSGLVFYYPMGGRGKMYEAPSTDSPAVASPPINGQRVVYTDTSPGWYYVHLPGKAPGWVPSGDVASVRPRTPIAPRPAKIRDSGIRGSGMQGTAAAGGRS